MELLRLSMRLLHIGCHALAVLAGDGSVGTSWSWHWRALLRLGHLLRRLSPLHSLFDSRMPGAQARKFIAGCRDSQLSSLGRLVRTSDCNWLVTSEVRRVK